MYLIKSCGFDNLQLIKFNKLLPPYAILSHTWGPASEEPNFQDINNCSAKAKAGFRKLEFCLKQAASDNLEYIWLDTACVDTKSSAELGEGINSMYKYYLNSTKCYVYLSDVPGTKFETSRWFQRAWTLQELLAPPDITFFSSTGAQIGNKTTLLLRIHAASKIPLGLLQGHDLSESSLAVILKLGSYREATREEDKIYSLLGMLSLHMTPIYGEGRHEALIRLCQEFTKRRELAISACCSNIHPSAKYISARSQFLELSFTDSVDRGKSGSSFINELHDIYPWVSTSLEHHQTSLVHAAYKQAVLADYKARAITCIGKIDSIGPQRRNEALNNEIKERYLTGLTEISRKVGLSLFNPILTFIHVGFTYATQRRHAQAEEMYLQALTWCEKRPDISYGLSLSLLLNLGTCYQRQDKNKEARCQYIRALREYQKSPEAYQMMILVTKHNLKDVCGRLRRSEHPKSNGHQALSGGRGMPGEDYSSMLKRYLDLGHLCHKQKRYAEAKKWYLEVLSGCKRTPEQGLVLNVQHNLGTIYLAQSMYAEAEQLFRKALAGRKISLGVEHRSTLKTYRCLGDALKAQGKLDEARRCHGRAMGLYTKQPGKKCDR